MKNKLTEREIYVPIGTPLLLLLISELNGSNFVAWDHGAHRNSFIIIDLQDGGSGAANHYQLVHVVIMFCNKLHILSEQQNFDSV